MQAGIFQLSGKKSLFVFCGGTWVARYFAISDPDSPSNQGESFKYARYSAQSCQGANGLWSDRETVEARGYSKTLPRPKFVD
jgi:hypothetical protein